MNRLEKVWHSRTGFGWDVSNWELRREAVQFALLRKREVSTISCTVSFHIIGYVGDLKGLDFN